MVIAQTNGFDNKISANAAALNSKNQKTKENKSAEDFMSFLNISGNTNSQEIINTNNESKDSATSVKNDSNDVKDSVDTYKREEDSSKVDDVSENSEKVDAKTDKTSDTKKEGSMEDLENISEDVIKDVLSSLQQSIMDMLNIDEDTLNNMLSDMGIEMSDLLDSNNLTNFVLFANDARSIDILTDENLADTVKQFNDALTNVLEEAGISDEDVDKVIDYIKENDLISDDIPSFDKEVVVDNNEIDDVKVSFEAPQKAAKSDSSNTTKDNDSQTSNNSRSETEIGNTVVQNLNEAINNLSEFTDKMDVPVSDTEIVNQIIEQIKVVVKEDTTSMELQLYPEHLGKIQIQVSTKDGVVTAQIFAENEMAKNAIESGLSNLKEAFNSQELKVEAVEVMVATTAFNQQNDDEANESSEGQKSTSNRKINLSELDELEDLDETEELEVAMMKATGNSISYQA